MVKIRKTKEKTRCKKTTKQKFQEDVIKRRAIVKYFIKTKESLTKSEISLRKSEESLK
jgi:hypothetical protein